MDAKLNSKEELRVLDEQELAESGSGARVAEKRLRKGLTEDPLARTVNKGLSEAASAAIVGLLFGAGSRSRPVRPEI